ncbi:MAG TPA: helix-turn-helix domain-containing protein [Chloroflexota bacterium]|nr:helix-turn-helix domain-containing protein [Chloroflexota bacterium]
MRELERVSQELQQRGLAEIADDIGSVIKVLQQQPSAAPAVEMVTTGEAAKLLNVRSVNAIKRWAADGLLEGFRHGSRILISQRSIERVQDSPTVADQRAFEAGLDVDLDPFDVGSERIDLEPPWGRKPWETPRANDAEPCNS